MHEEFKNGILTIKHDGDIIVKGKKKDMFGNTVFILDEEYEKTHIKECPICNYPKGEIVSPQKRNILDEKYYYRCPVCGMRTEYFVCLRDIEHALFKMRRYKKENTSLEKWKEIIDNYKPIDLKMKFRKEENNR